MTRNMKHVSEKKNGEKIGNKNEMCKANWINECVGEMWKTGWEISLLKACVKIVKKKCKKRKKEEIGEGKVSIKWLWKNKGVSVLLIM